MPRLLAIAEALILEKVVMGQLGPSRKNRIGFGLMALSVALVLVAVGFSIVAFHAWIEAQYQNRPDMVALMTAAGVFALAIVVALTAVSLMEYKRARTASIKNEIKDTLSAAIAGIDDELGDQIRENPAMAMALAGLAGFIAANKIT